MVIIVVYECCHYMTCFIVANRPGMGGIVPEFWALSQ